MLGKINASIRPRTRQIRIDVPVLHGYNDCLGTVQLFHRLCDIGDLVRFYREDDDILLSRLFCRLDRDDVLCNSGLIAVVVLEDDSVAPDRGEIGRTRQDGDGRWVGRKGEFGGDEGADGACADDADFCHLDERVWKACLGGNGEVGLG